MITNKDEAEGMTQHISCDCKCKFSSTTCNSKQKWIDKTFQFKCKNYRQCKKDYSWNPGTCICENSKYLKSVVDTSVTECDEIVIVMNNLSTNKDKCYNNNCCKYCFNKLAQEKSKRLLYFAYTFISDHITIDNHYY